MSNIKGELYLMGAFSLAGTSVITGHILAMKLSSFTITAISLGIVLVCLFPFYVAKTVQTIRMLTKNDVIMIMFQAIFGVFLFRTFLLFGVNLTSTVEAGILTSVTPAVTSLLAFFFLKKRFSAATALGIGCTVAGIIFFAGNQSFFRTVFCRAYFRKYAYCLCCGKRIYLQHYFKKT